MTAMTDDVTGATAGRTRQLPPFHCPYCGDEGLRPMGEGHGDWRCTACRRGFRLKYLGLTDSSGGLPATATIVAAGAGAVDGEGTSR